jgi:hypothetical protein
MTQRRDADESLDRPPMTAFVRAQRDDALSARIVRSCALRYRVAADPGLDRLAFVRAASGLAWVGTRLAVVQDDANYIALVDPADGGALAVPLPAGPGGGRLFDDARGNKANKLDLEALVSVPDVAGAAPLLVALGSGSSPRRERVVICRGLDAARLEAPHVSLYDARVFYAGLRAITDFAGSELNLEGAVYLGGGRLRLFGRGNGAARDGLQPVNATCDVHWRALLAYLEAPDDAPPPMPENVVQFELGAVDGVALSFTDAAVRPGDAAVEPTLLYTAAAEASPDATRDGAVTGSAIGIIAPGPAGTTARWTPLCDAAGRPCTAKVEGIVLAAGGPGRLYVVLDRDAHDEPSELCEVELEGPWFGRE